MNLTGKDYLITGASSGLGFAISKKLAKLSANTIMLCRNQENGDKAVLEIKKEAPDASLDLMICDLASMSSIQSFLRDFKGKYSKLDLLFNNAAVMKQKRMVTNDGFEMMFQVNYLAPFILTKSLLEILKKSSSPQIINNGRPADKYRLDFDDLQFSKNFHMYDSFFQTKLCLLFSSLELSRRQISDELVIIMADPGPFKSNLVRDARLAGWMKNLFSAPVEKAAENIMFVITSEGTKNNSGKVFKEKQEYPLTSYWQDTNVSERLWSTTETMIEDFQIP